MQLKTLRRSLFVLLFLAASLQAHAEGGEGAAAPPGRAAIPSKLAANALLLDAARAGQRMVAVGERGHVVLSDDGGQSWRQAQHVPTRASLTSVFFVDAERGWAVGHDATIVSTRNGGESWRLQRTAPEEEIPLLAVWFTDAQHGLAVGAFSLMLQTTDGGKRWQRLPPPGGGEVDHHLNDIFSGPNGTLFIAAERGTVYRSRDGGLSWQTLGLPYTGSLWGGLALAHDAVLVYGMRGHVFRSDNLGESWLEIASPTDKSLSGGTRLEGDGVALAGLGGVVLLSDDGGRSFRPRVRPGRRGFAAVATTDGRSLLLFGEDGVEKPER